MTPATSVETFPENSNTETQDRPSHNDLSIENFKNSTTNVTASFQFHQRASNLAKHGYHHHKNQPDAFFNFDDASHLEQNVRTEYLNTQFSLSPLNLSPHQKKKFRDRYFADSFDSEKQ